MTTKYFISTTFTYEQERVCYDCNFIKIVLVQDIDMTSKASSFSTLSFADLQIGRRNDDHPWSHWPPCNSDPMQIVPVCCRVSGRIVCFRFAWRPAVEDHAKLHGVWSSKCRLQVWGIPFFLLPRCSSTTQGSRSKPYCWWCFGRVSSQWLSAVLLASGLSDFELLRQSSRLLLMLLGAAETPLGSKWTLLWLQSH